MMKKKFIFFIQPKSVVSLTFISFLAFSGLFIPPYSNLEKAELYVFSIYFLFTFYIISKRQNKYKTVIRKVKTPVGTWWECAIPVQGIVTEGLSHNRIPS